jgi:hypothetical protein
MEKLKELAKQKWVQLVGALALGITIGAVFYPQSKTTERLREEMKEEYSLKEEALQKEHSKIVAELSEKITSIESSHREYTEETQHKLEKLTQENSSLKQSVKKKKLKIVKPDGTIVEQEVEESNTEQTHSIVTQVKEEFTRKVQEIEDRWKKLHQERVAEITAEHEAELKKVREEQRTVEVIVEKEKIVETNPKKLRPEIGVTTDRNVYLHGTYSLWGPVFIGGGVSGTHERFGDGRLGLGLEF